MRGKTINEIKIGDTVEIERFFSEKDVLRFAEVSGDFNPAHMDEDYAKQSVFGARIVHGMLVASLFSTIFGVHLLGLGSIYTKQSLKFTRPVLIGDTIRASVTVKECLLDRNRVLFDCLAINQKNETVIIGEAEIMPPKQGE